MHATATGTARIVWCRRPAIPREQAERALKAKLAKRSLFQPAASTLTPDSPFRDLVTYWLEDLGLEGRLSKRTFHL